MSSSFRIRPDPANLVARYCLAVSTALILTFPAAASGRPAPIARSGSSPDPSQPLVTGLVTQDLATGGQTPAGLVQTLLGAGAVVSNVQYTGAPVAAGVFTGGSGIIGFERGVILGTGDIALVVGPVNVRDDTGADHNLPGDPDLDAIVGYGATHDAAILEFDLECPAGNGISFQFVFASEEYDNSVAGPQDDLFACLLNGQNIALVPGTSSPVSIHTVNCGYPYNPPGGTNCGYYITNDCNSLNLGYPCSNIETEMNGLTTVLSASGTLQPGANHVKLAIADHWDTGYDSNVFLRAQSFDCTTTLTPPSFDAPSPCSQVLDAPIGLPFDFDVVASATNGLPGDSIVLEVTGDAVPLIGGVFVPPLPAGPAQPVSTQFQWTPTLADVGLYHLTFSATDQLLQSTQCDVVIRVPPLSAPAFESPSPCAQTLDATVGVPLVFGVQASATNGLPGETVTLDVTGDAIPLAGGTFDPPLPAGPAQPVSTQFQWTPDAGEVGTYQLVFWATDLHQASASCVVTIRVSTSPGVDLCQAGTGQVIDCPCGNPPAFSPGGCDNSAGTGGARLFSTGLASLIDDTVVLTTAGELPNSLSIVVQGKVSLPAGVYYGQGLRCLGGSIKRLYVKSASVGSITAPQAGDPTVSIRSLQRGDLIAPGTSRFYAVWYRDPTVLGGCPPIATFNSTQTQEIAWSQ